MKVLLAIYIWFIDNSINSIHLGQISSGEIINVYDCLLQLTIKIRNFIHKRL